MVNFRYGVGKFPLRKKDGRFGARIHHKHVRPELLQAPGKILAISVFVDESKKIEITLRIPHHPFEIIDLKQTQITVIILDSLLLQLRALFRCQFVSVAFLFSPARTLLVIFQERLAIVRTPPIGATCHFHLQNSEIHAQLQFFAAVETGNFPHLDGAALVGPIVRDRVKIQAHRTKHPTLNVRLSITSRVWAPAPTPGTARSPLRRARSIRELQRTNFPLVSSSS